MKKLTLFFVIFFAMNVTTLALPPTPSGEKTYTEMFDIAFSRVSKAQATTGILYERVVPFANLTSSTDTTNFTRFIQAYSELYRAAFDTTAQLLWNVADFEAQIKNNAASNIVDIGILHYNFNSLDSVVASQKLIIDTFIVRGDTTILVREDTTISASLYQEKTTFLVSPLSDKVMRTNNIIYRFNNNFNFDNTGASLTSLMVDFDDGRGLRQVSIGSNVPVFYSDGGKKTLQFVATYSNGQTLTANATMFLPYLVYFTKSGSWKYNDVSITAKISHLGSYGVGDIRTYYANTDKKLRKPILIIDGFDPGNKRQFDSIVMRIPMMQNILEINYAESIWDLFYYKDKNQVRQNIGDQLLELGYDLIILDLPDGGGDIIKNSMVCIETINYINKKLLQDNECADLHKIIVVGPSMGGQIARYALAYMEQNFNANTNYGNHNCGLYVSFDSPHQGANISLGAQAFLQSVGYTYGEEEAKKNYDSMIMCPAAKQMLMHHYSTGGNSSAPEYITYYNTINTLGYPENCRKIAVANGSLNNTPNGVAGEEVFHGKTKGIGMLQGMESYIYNAPNSGFNNEILSIWYAWHTDKKAYFNNNTGKCSPDAAPGCYFGTYDEIAKAFEVKVLGTPVTSIYTNKKKHTFMPTTSVLDIQGNYDYCSDFSNINFTTPFDAYYAPDTNMEHVTFNDEIVTFLLDEIENASNSVNPPNFSVIGIGNSYSTADTLFAYNSCDDVTYPDTIYYKDKNDLDVCLSNIGDYDIYFPINIKNIDLAYWTINGKFIGMWTGEYNYAGNHYYYFHLSSYRHLWNRTTDDYITVIAEIYKGPNSPYDSLIFKFKVDCVNDCESQFTSYWDESGFLYELGDKNLTINTDLKDGLTIPLPYLVDCYLDDVKIDKNIEWEIREDGLFIPPTEECDVNIVLFDNCECVDGFNINIGNQNTDCYCNDIIWTETSRQDENPCGDRIWTITASISDSERKITKVEYNFDTYMVDEEYDYADGVPEISNSFNLGYFSPPYSQPFDPISICIDVKVTLDNGVQCSNYFYNSPNICRSSGNDVIKDFKYIYREAEPEVMLLCDFNFIPAGPIKVSIVDLVGVERISIYNGMLISLSNQFSVNVSDLQTGLYYIKLEATAENEILSIPFIKQ